MTDTTPQPSTTPRRVNPNYTGLNGLTWEQMAQLGSEPSTTPDAPQTCERG